MKLVHLPISFLLFIGAINANSQTAPTVNTLIPFASGLSKPVDIAHANDSRLFVVGQQGYIHIVNSTGNVNPQPFLDIHERVVYGGERGLLGLAFHPQYQTNGYFYVNYVGNGDSTHISRFTVSSGNADLADPSSELKLLTILQPYANHNGGDLCFGPDGYLYIGSGDGGSGGDPGNRAQNTKALLGKILRIDLDHGNPYTIPESNPFYNSNTALPEIWALGLRNPWRFSFDRFTGDLWIGDVGQNNSEEINFQAAGTNGGVNYGWRCYEGNLAYNSNDCPPAASFSFPVYTYQHGDECSVTGGYVYRGSTSSPFYGYYFFADYCSDRVWTLHNASGNWVMENFGQFSGNNFSTFGEDSNGQLYVAGVSSGKIFRINDLSTGVIQQENTPEIQIIQSPFSDKIRIETGRNDQTKMTIHVFDVKGINLYQTNTMKSSYELDLHFLSSGVYVLNVKIEGNSYSHKVILGK